MIYRVPSLEGSTNTIKKIGEILSIIKGVIAVFVFWLWPAGGQVDNQFRPIP
jgi:hypothetical protein